MILVNKLYLYILTFLALAGIVDFLFFLHVIRKIRIARKEDNNNE